MDESFTAYLEQVQRQRAELGESMAALEAALTLPAGAGPVWRRRVRAALTELSHDLRDHANLTEVDGGLYADIGVTAIDLLLTAADSPDAEPRHVVFRPELVARPSTGAT